MNKLHRNQLLLLTFVILCIFSFLLIRNSDKYSDTSSSITKTQTPSIDYKENKNQSATYDTYTKKSTLIAYKTYTNKEYDFSIKYPIKIEGLCNSANTSPQLNPNPDLNWEIYEQVSDQESQISFGPKCSKMGGYLWGVNIHKNLDIENLIRQIGIQFPDRKEVRENIIVNGKRALLVTVTTNQIDNWVGKAVFIINNGDIFDIENGAVIMPEFNDFYNSFTFIK